MADSVAAIQTVGLMAATTGFGSVSMQHKNLK
jgi:hypothetical protein